MHYQSVATLNREYTSRDYERWQRLNPARYNSNPLQMDTKDFHMSSEPYQCSLARLAYALDWLYNENKHRDEWLAEQQAGHVKVTMQFLRINEGRNDAWYAIWNVVGYHQIQYWHSYARKYEPRWVMCYNENIHVENQLYPTIYEPDLWFAWNATIKAYHVGDVSTRKVRYTALKCPVCDSSIRIYRGDKDIKRCDQCFVRVHIADSDSWSWGE